MGITSLAIRFAAPLPKLERFKRYLFIGPHPDDIEIGAGATAAKLAASGKNVAFLICTDGRYGDAHSKGITGAELAALRRTEAIASAARLGVRDVTFLDLEDGSGYTREALLYGIARVIGAFRPDVIFAPDPAPVSECHADHLNVGVAARELACFAPYPGIMQRYGAKPADVQAIAFYMTAKPTAFVNTRDFFPFQIRALFDCHRSQYPEGSSDTAVLRTYLRLRSIDFGLRCGCSCAEGFRLLGKTHMHCLPEAGR